jgi:hypothetical protein
MKLDPEQLEWIVREVLRRLTDGRETAKHAPMVHGDLYLTDALVTTETLRGRLTDVRRIAVQTKAVVTPAAKDLLRDHDVKLIRR